MGRKPKPEGELKLNLTIRLPKFLIDKLRKEENYNGIIQKLVESYYKLK